MIEKIIKNIKKRKSSDFCSCCPHCVFDFYYQLYKVCLGNLLLLLFALIKVRLSKLTEDLTSSYYKTSLERFLSFILFNT